MTILFVSSSSYSSSLCASYVFFLSCVSTKKLRDWKENCWRCYWNDCNDLFTLLDFDTNSATNFSYTQKHTGYKRLSIYKELVTFFRRNHQEDMYWKQTFFFLSLDFSRLESLCLCLCFLCSSFSTVLGSSFSTLIGFLTENKKWNKLE